MLAWKNTLQWPMSSMPFTKTHGNRKSTSKLREMLTAHVLKNTFNTTKYRNVLRIAQTTMEPLGKLTTFLLHGLTMIYYMEYSILIGQSPMSYVIQR